jgi:threonine/homoserine/homoserine lactone efflux protein
MLYAAGLADTTMTWPLWIAFFVTETALCFTPGPAVLFFVVKWAGAAYLVWLAVCAFVGKFKVMSVEAGGRAPVTHLATRPRFAAITNRVAGTLLIGAGVGMTAIRKT